MVLLVVSLTAVVIALGAAAYAWRVARNDRERSDARVAALAAAIDGTPTDESPAPMFERAPRAGLQGRPLMKVGVGFVMAVLVIVLIAMSSGRHKGNVAEAAATAAAPGQSLELLSMRHARAGKNLIVTGLVRNPARRLPDDEHTRQSRCYHQRSGSVGEIVLADAAAPDLAQELQ